MQYFFDSILYNVSYRTRAGGCKLTHLTQQAHTSIGLKYLAELSVVILKFFQIITKIHYQTSIKSIRNLKCNKKATSWLAAAVSLLLSKCMIDEQKK